MFEGIIGQTSISCKQSSRGGIDNLATEVDAGNAISSMSIQPVSDTNVSSSASVLLDSVDELHLGSTTSSSVSTLSNVVPHSDESHLGSTTFSSISTLSNVLPHSGASRAALSNTVFGLSPCCTNTTLPFTSSVSSVTQSEVDIPTTASVNFLPSLLSLSLHERSGPIIPRMFSYYHNRTVELQLTSLV